MQFKPKQTTHDSRHTDAAWLQRLELLVRVGLGLGLGGYRLALPWLQACSTQRRLELPWQRASTTSSTTTVAGLQQAAAPRAPVAIG
eukprot:scaffold31362_cov75-Phaeocystis_antarctica.AAC.1